MLEANPNLENIIFNFLSQKDYVGEREAFSKKVVLLFISFNFVYFALLVNYFFFIDC